MHATRNIFKKEKLNMKNCETAFHFFNNLEIYRCASKIMELQLKYFVFFFQVPEE